MEMDVIKIPFKIRTVILISVIWLACIFLLTCTAYEWVPYQPNKSNLYDPRSFIKKTIERQSPKYVNVPIEVEVTNEYIKLIHLETYSTGEKRAVPTQIYFEDIGDIKLVRGDIWWVEIFDQTGIYFIGVVTIKENLAKKFIDALYVLKDSKKIKPIGSGFLISETGLAITAYHVVESAKNIEIVFPSKNISKSAYLKIKDIRNDLAILKINNFNFSDISNKEIPYTLADINKIKVGC
jgi:S1-C subfamily serine protease